MPLGKVWHRPRSNSARNGAQACHHRQIGFAGSCIVLATDAYDALKLYV